MDLSSGVALFDTLAKIGFAGVMFLALVGSYAGIWEWSKGVKARELKAEAREAALEARLKVEAEASQRRIDQLIEKVVATTQLVAETARQVVTK